MADYFDRRDIGAVTTFGDADALFEFQFESYEQLVFNESSSVLEVSFDGINVHARLNATGPSAVIHWASHVRRKLWVKNAGSPGSGKMVQVLATTG